MSSKTPADGWARVAARVYATRESAAGVRGQIARIVTSKTGRALPQTLEVVERLVRENRV